jgi:hypothetical protein
MLIGPIILLVVVPALQTMFLRRGGGPAPTGPEPLEEPAEAHT